MKISVVKEPSLLREGIIRILQEHFSNHEIIAYGSKQHNELVIESNLADLVILDLDTDLDFKSLVDFYKTHNKRVIVWTSNVNHPALMNLFQLQLHGFFYNGMEREELLNAIMSVMNGGIYIHQSLSPTLLGYYVQRDQPQKPVGVFSEREWEIIELLTKGLKNGQIANFLFISEKTVKNYVSAIMKKMDVPDRTNIVITAVKKKWIAL